MEFREHNIKIRIQSEVDLIFREIHIIRIDNLMDNNNNLSF